MAFFFWPQRGQDGFQSLATEVSKTRGGTPVLVVTWFREARQVTETTSTRHVSHEK